MEIDIEILLALPQSERKKIAEQFRNSLSPTHLLSKKDKKIVDLLDKRWGEIQSVKSKVYSSSEMKNLVSNHRKTAKYRLTNCSTLI